MAAILTSTSFFFLVTLFLSSLSGSGAALLTGGLRRTRQIRQTSVGRNLLSLSKSNRDDSFGHYFDLLQCLRHQCLYAKLIWIEVSVKYRCLFNFVRFKTGVIFITFQLLRFEETQKERVKYSIVFLWTCWGIFFKKTRLKRHSPDMRETSVRGNMCKINTSHPPRPPSAAGGAWCHSSHGCWRRRPWWCSLWSSLWPHHCRNLETGDEVSQSGNISEPILPFFCSIW